MANRLVDETSPYLLQHAHNPVDWYPWGSEAFARARAEQKPILLSIGYSACHWCHVMERESFENDDTAQLMNSLFVNVKVDREERPDVDAIYMQAVQAMTGHGGWPMTTFLTPDLVPFWGGTYFPPEDRHGMPSFRRVLEAVADAYQNRPDDVQRVADSMREMYSMSEEKARSTGQLTPAVLDRASRALLAQHDATDGGFGGAPKFPQPMAMEFLLQRWARAGNEAALECVRHSFLAMSRGGIHDQLGGGFSRYSVDAQWLVPHFEKMLYDNALLLRLGSHLLQVADDHPTAAEIRAAGDGIVRWLAEEMTSPEGGFHSALDADSEGHEGKFYVWTADEIRELLGADTDRMMEYWGASDEGNFEGANILHVPDPRRRPPPDMLSRSSARLLEARAGRIRPSRDDKILASWNGFMLRALAEYTWSDAALAMAKRNAEFLHANMVRDGRVFRSFKDGQARIPGFLEDHASVALGYLALYERTFERVWLDRARELANSVIAWFWDDATNAFFDTASDHEELVTRPRNLSDNATPAGTSLAAELLLRISNLFGDAELARRASFTLETLAEPMARHPLAFGHTLCATDMVVHGAVEVALVGDVGAGGLRELAAVAGQRYVPSRVMVAGTASELPDLPLMTDRPAMDGKPTAYVCRGYVCERPVTRPDELWDQLSRVVRG
jgi:uncharacterized protein YyaL (SSP411 family)